jgi:hypothetical protein
MSVAVYIVCTLTSVVCTLLLLRGYWQGGPRLLLWSALCFAGLAADNLLLILDLIVFPHVNLLPIRSLPSLIGLGLLIYGLVWDTK